MPNFELRLYEDGDYVGSFNVHSTDEPITVNQIIEEIQNAEMRKERLAYRMRRLSYGRPLTLQEYARYCFAPHLRPPLPQVLTKPIPFSTYVDEYGV